MTRFAKFLLAAAWCSALGPAAVAEEKAAELAKIEFRWAEWKPVKGVTEEKGIRTSCGDELTYLHAKPVLTNKDVADATLTHHDFSRSGLSGSNYMVKFRLTADARKALVAAVGDRPGGVLAVVIDGKYWGLSNFQKKDADTFAPVAGYMTSSFDAEWIVHSVTKK